MLGAVRSVEDQGRLIDALAALLWRAGSPSESAGVSKLATVLFLRSGNSARSQIAEGLLRHLAGDCFEVYSAGLDAKPIHPLTHEVMAEIGIDTIRPR